MAPGPRKKRGQRNEEKSTSHTKHDVKGTESNTAVKPLSSGEKSVEHPSDNQDNSGYHKAEIKSNWYRFEEPDVDPNADVTRGTDYEVLLSYSGGAGSQLQLQEEREWEEQSLNTKSPIFDLNFLCSAYKCIPFHKQIHLAEDIFEISQLQRFHKCAEVASKAFATMLEQEKEPEQSTPEKMIDGFQLDIVEKSKSPTPDPSESVTFGNSVPVLPEKTENLIESLTSCLSLKSEKSDAQSEEKAESSAADDLDFLLTLTSEKAADTHAHSPEKPNIDDWLNDILDD